MPNIKLKDKEFIAILRKNAGIYSRTVKAIKKEFGIDISRQAVRQRAEKFPNEVADIEEQNIDIAEEGLQDLMRSNDERVKLRAVEIYLNTKGKERGYVKRHELTGKGGEAIKTEATVIMLPKKDIQ